MTREEEQLRDLLRDEVRKASEEAIKLGGFVASSEVERLESLSKLVTIAQEVQRPAPRRRWLLAGVLAGTLAIVSLLLFARITATDIELDVTTGEAGFSLTTAQPLTELLPLTAIGASGLTRVELPRAPGDIVSMPASTGDAPGGVYIATAAKGAMAGQVSLAAITAPAGTRVRFQRIDGPRRYRLSLAGHPIALQLDVQGPVRIAVGGGPAELRTFQTPRPVMLGNDSSLLDLDVELGTPSARVFAPQLDASDLVLFRTDELHDDVGMPARRVSTIESGTLHLEALDGPARNLRPGEPLHFDRAVGLIREIRLGEDRIQLRFRGRVSGMSTGWGETRRSLMPTYLEWLKARHGLYLLWGSTLYLFGIVGSLLRWWGVRV